MASEVAARWGLPSGFEPVRFPIEDEIKTLLRELLGPNEPVLVTVATESNSVSLVATNLRLFLVKTGAGAGVTGVDARDFTWEAITDMRLAQMGTNVKISVHFKSRDGGRTAEVGKKSGFAKDAVQEMKPVESNAGTLAFEAINLIWHQRQGHILED